MIRYAVIILAAVVPLLLACINPDDPFNDIDNAFGTITISSERGLQTETIFYDSTGNPINIRATFFLPEYIDSGILNLRYGDTTYDTMARFSFNRENPTAHETLDTTVVLPRGGRITVKLKAFIRGGYSTSDSAALFLYCKPIPLSSLSIVDAEISPAFNDTTTAYAATVSNNHLYLSLIPATDNPFSVITVNGDTVVSDSASAPCSLTVGSTDFAVKTIADDHSTEFAYSIVITRLPGSVATLDSIILSAGTLDPAFDTAGLPEYTAIVIVDYETDTLSITAFPTHSAATISIDTGAGKRGPASFRIPLLVGSNAVELTVVAEDSVTAKEYQIAITRKKSGNASLSDIILSRGTLSPPFHADTLRYTVAIPFVDSMVTVTPRCSDADAVVSIEGDTVPRSVTLSTGLDSIFIEVIAPDGATTATYMVVFTRAPGSDAALLQITPSTGTLTPSFDPDILSYTITVADSNNTISFSVQPRHDKASIKINGARPDSAFTLAAMAVTPFNIVATAEDGSTKKTYLVSVTRKGSDSASLAGIEVTAGELYPSFHRDTLNYELRIPSDTSNVRVKPSPVHNRATLTVKGTSVNAGTWSQDIEAPPGKETSFDIVVTSETGKLQKTYHFVGNRAFVLTVNNDGNGNTVPDGNADAFVGIPHAVSAAPATGYHFDRWEVVSGTATIASAADTATTVLVETAAEVQAKFALNRYRLTVTGSGNGTVNGGDSALHGIPETITATASPGHHFAVWRVLSGNARLEDSLSAATTVTLENGDAVVQALFGINDYQLTVTGNGNGSVNGTGPVTHGVAKRISATPDTGYHFGGWGITAGTATIVDPSAATTDVTLTSGDATVEGTFTINQYTLTYDGNGHTDGSPPLEETHDYRTTVTVAGKGDLAKTGYLFSGWNSEPDGSGSDYPPGGSFTIDAGNDTLYVKWESYTYTITFDGQDATTPTDPTGKTVTSPATTVDALPVPPLKTGYIFGGWFSEINGGGTVFTANTVVTADDTVYAKWNSYDYTVNFDAGQDATPPDPTSITVTSPATTVGTLPTPPSKTCHWFSGWYTEENGGGTVFTEATVVTADLTVYAKWEFRETIYVDSAADSDVKTGRSWDDAFTDLQDALAAACDGSEILIAKGTYLPDTASRDSSFVLKNGVKLYGGYPHEGGQRNVGANPAILSGEIQGDDYAPNNTYTVVNANNLDSTALLDGVHISDGYAVYRGGGMLAVNSSVVLSNCIFIRNRCVAADTGMGAAIYILGGHPKLSKCRFLYDTCDGSYAQGGAIFMSDGVLTECSFEECCCTGIACGGAIKMSDGKLTDCTFLNNGTFSGMSCYGGAISMSDGRLTNCIFQNNISKSEAMGSMGSGGALEMSNGYLEHCCFIGNRAQGSGGGDGGALRMNTGTLMSCSFLNNISSGTHAGGGAIDMNTGILTNCTFFENHAENGGYPSDGGAINAFNGTLANCTFTGNSCNGSARGGAIHFDGTVSEIYNCIFWNNIANTDPEIAGVPAVIKYCIIKGGYAGGDDDDTIYTHDPDFEALDTTTGPVPFIPIPVNSPARDSGTTNVPGEIDIRFDCRGFPRDDGHPDIGAYEVR